MTEFIDLINILRYNDLYFYTITTVGEEGKSYKHFVYKVHNCDI